MIYTSYFANWRNFPEGSYAVGVVRFTPEWWRGPNLIMLAPSEDLLRQFKNKEIDEFIFKQKYLRELDERNLKADDVKIILNSIHRDIILCCYETPEEFCHRHILAEWLGGVKELP